MTQVITSMQLGCLPSFSTTVKCYRVLVSLSSVSKSSSQNNSSSEISSKGASLASPLIFVRLRFLFPLLVHWQTSVQIRPLAEHEQAFPVHLLTLQPHETYSSRASGADGWDIHSMERPSSTENSHCLPTGDGQSSFATNAFYHIAACLVVGSWCATIDSLVKGEDHYFSSFLQNSWYRTSFTFVLSRSPYRAQTKVSHFLMRLSVGRKPVPISVRVSQ
jgi:hypothetical protein